MAKFIQTVDINIIGLDEFKNLVELLEKHFDDLPDELQESLKEVEGQGINDINRDYLESMFPDYNPELLKSNIPNTDRIISVNRILKKVVIYYNKGAVIEQFPTSFLLEYDGNTIVKW